MAPLGLSRIAGKEITRRRLGFLLSVLAAAAAAAAVIASLASMQAYDRETEALLAKRRQAMEEGLRRYDQALRHAVKNLGFNVVILPGKQQLADFYADDYARETMPESDARKLAGAELMTIGQLAPCLRRKIEWPEKKWTIQIAAYGASQVRPQGKDDAFALRLLPPGKVDIGWELHRALNINAGDKLVLHGKTFRVRACVPLRGTRDDITVWMNLGEAQKLLGLEGRISEILALECRTSWNRLDRVAAEIRHVLPQVKIIEKGTETLATAAARKAFAEGQLHLLEDLRKTRNTQRGSRRRLAWMLCLGAMLLGAGTAGVVSVTNARERRGEMALWRALGVSGVTVQLLLAMRALAAALSGTLLGALIALSGRPLPPPDIVLPWVGYALGTAAIIMIPGGCFAAILAARSDPAITLKNEV